jgi:diguanylate cyclase (GGDEF)-like protein/PAS domain S-box-containing protein
LRLGDFALKNASHDLSVIQYGGTMTNGARKPGKQQILQLLHRAMDHLNLGVTITSLDGKILYTNQAEARMHGYEISDLVGKDARIFAPRDLWKGITLDQAREISSWRRESVNIRKDGTVFPVQIVSDVIADDDGNPQAVITICDDITDRTSSFAAYYDPLTGLPNRTLFMDRLGRSVKRTKRRTDYLFALLYIDLDQFKAVNDASGRDIGDRLLVACARRIEASLRFGDTVAHLGGDEFTVLLEDIRAVKDATFVADRIQQHLALPFNINDQDFYISASIGIAKGSSGYDRPEDILHDSNTAMYRAKVQGKNRYELFDDSMLTRSMALLPLELNLRRAMENQELRVEYQPIYSLESTKLEGCEAFLRWQHPERGLVFPEEFVPLAEETGMMASIGEWLLQQSCAQVKNWQDTIPELKLCIRVTAAETMQHSWIRTLSRILEQTGIPPSTLEIQISEPALMQNAEKITPLLDEVRKKGVQISISDYGSGHSSLEYMQRFQINSLKLDRAFLRDITQNKLQESVATAMITLAHSLRIRIAAEDVESEEQLAFLRWHHCDAAQGPLFSPPVPAEDFVKLLT